MLLVLLAACGAAHTPKRPTTGAITGLVRDVASGEGLEHASLRLSNGMTTESNKAGMYTLDDLKPGRYSLVAEYAGQPVTIKNIDVTRGEATYVDVKITLGATSPVTVDFADPQNAITHYKPKQEIAIIEGAVSEMNTHERVAGAVVTVVGGPRGETLQTVTDDQGRYRFDAVEPGTYDVSAYYNVGGHGQIEVRRSGIEVERAQGVIVPLVVETTR